ncbi:peptidase C1B, bleomycin hydrolase [Polychaeton citri CBS 116435]|uniref:Cysteine proteinase 1, mitochondrial n=1 Tax=Polychaeton citri CBS 116435 TaxID=1314669 RepID=A0A9P4QI62_9PEZI|nr:peptidase C1B, bleomycin hydrolase [Polychaeton citri CBS 116435]
MGGSQSSINPPPPYHTLARQHRRASRSPSRAIDEKLQSFHISPPAYYNGDDDIINANSVLSGASKSTISAPATSSYVTELLTSSKNRLALSALSTANPALVLEEPSAIISDTQTFNVKIPHEGSPVTNQRSSGRCWIFAACNVFRIQLAQKYNLDKLELSQSYLFFWDKVEKANWFLESIVETAEEEDLDGRLVQALLASPVGDGGQWDMIINLVEKYGVIPQTLYPDSWNAQNSSTMDRLLTSFLREAGLKLRSLKTSATVSTDDILEEKEKMLQAVIRIATLCLGPPPAADKPFTWEFYDKTGNFHLVATTPLDFAEPLAVKNTVSLVNDPRNNYLSLLTVSYLGNVWGGRPITYVNVSMDVMKAACIKTLQAGLPIFFGSDVGKMSDSSKGILDPKLTNYPLGFSIPAPAITKAQRLQTGESQMTHAMVLTAVHLCPKTGKPLRWRIENSWSDAAGSQGYFVMTDAWMDEFVYQAVVKEEFISKAVKEVAKKGEKKVLPLWDPMGALA